MRFDLVDLALFVASADGGSLTRGAEHCGIALAAASARIRLMEDRLAVKLFERSRRGMTLTPAGTAMLRHARRLLETAADLEADVAEFSGGLKGRVRLLSNTTALAEYLPQSLGSFLADRPDIAVSVEERLSHDIIRAVGAGEADIGIVAGSADLTGLESFPFAQDRLVVVAAKGSIGPEPVAFQSLLDHAFIGLREDSAIQSFVAMHAVQAGRPIRLRMQMLGFDAICRMVESEAGIAVIPQSAAIRAAATMTIDIVGLLDPWAVRDLRICVASEMGLPSVARLLLTHLRDGGSLPHPTQGARSDHQPAEGRSPTAHETPTTTKA